MAASRSTSAPGTSAARISASGRSGATYVGATGWSEAEALPNLATVLGGWHVEEVETARRLRQHQRRSAPEPEEGRANDEQTSRCTLASAPRPMRPR